MHCSKRRGVNLQRIRIKKGKFPLLRRRNRHRRSRSRSRSGRQRRLSSSSGIRSSSNSSIALLGIQHGLQLGRGLEARVVRVLLVKVVVRLGLQLGGQVLEDAGDEGVDGVLLGRVAVPDGDEVGVEADGEADAADLVGCVTKVLVIAFLKFCFWFYINAPSSITLWSFSPMASSWMRVQKSGPMAFGTRNVQLPPLMLRRSSQMGRKPDLKRYIDSRILMFSTGVLLL